MQLFELHQSSFLACNRASRPLPSCCGIETQVEYQWTPPARAGPTIQFHFCKICGIRTPGRGDLEVMGGVFYAVQVPLLDDIDPDELAAAPIRYLDGRHDNFDRPPAEVRFL